MSVSLAVMMAVTGTRARSVQVGGGPREVLIILDGRRTQRR